MENNWDEVLLGDYAIFSYGKMPKKDKIGKGDFITYSGYKYIDRYPEYNCNKGDLIVVARGVGGTGDVKITDKDCFLTNLSIKIDLDNEFIDNKYLYYYYSQINLKYLDSGSAQSQITINDLKKVVVKIPPINIQNAIVKNLSALDDKIELNRQMNQTLEQMAQALFKSWFVDFDPVIDNALVAGNSIPEELQARAEKRKALGKDRKALPKDIQKLFPDEFEYSEELEKWVPRGWKLQAVDECLEINPKVKLTKGSIAKFVDMKALPTKGYSISGIISKELTSGGSKFNQGDVLLARITPCLENGKTGIVDFLSENEAAFGSTEFIVMRGKGVIRTPFVACLARDNNFRKHCMQSMVGSSGRQRVQNACFSNYFVAVPEDEKILNLFDEQTRDNFQQITKKINTNYTHLLLLEILFYLS
jgi:Restriction endonuclease S subunits